MTTEEYELLSTDAKSRLSEAKADLEALERVRNMRNRVVHGVNGQDESLPSASRGELKKAIKEFVAATHGTFTMLDVFKAIDDAGQLVAKKQSIKTTLGNLEKGGEIETVIRGAGRKPSVYRRKK